MEYISKEDVLGKLYLDHKDVTYIDKNAAAERIKKIQGIDIVRCKECKYERDGEEFMWCEHPKGLDSIVKPDDFCSYGEREGE